MSFLPSLRKQAGRAVPLTPFLEEAACRGSGPVPRRPLKRGRGGEGSWALCFPTCLPAPRPGLPGKQLHSWVPPRALLRWEAGPTVVGPWRREEKENYYRDGKRDDPLGDRKGRAGRGASGVSRQAWG